MATTTAEQAAANPALMPDVDSPAHPGLDLAQFAAGCFWSVELAFQRLEGVVKTEVGYSQGHFPDPTYKDVCNEDTGHAEVVRLHFDPAVCSYENLLALFWSRHDPTTRNRQAMYQITQALEDRVSGNDILFWQGFDVGTQYRSGIYYYNEEQSEFAKKSLDQQQKKLENEIVTEILPAKKFYRAEEYHQQFLEKGGRRGAKQSARKGCNDPIRCYG